MSEEEKPDNTQFSIGYTDQSQAMMVIFVPLKTYSDSPDGTALLRGKMDEAKAIGLMRIQQMRQKKETISGIIKPNGQVPLGVQ
jgi:hypothetical protein